MDSAKALSLEMNCWGKTASQLASKEFGHSIVGSNCLHFAAWRGFKELAQHLLTAGVGVNSKNNYGSTALYFAAYPGHSTILEMLLDAGADVNNMDNYRWTALHSAAGHNRLGAVRLLLHHGAATEVEAGDGQTPLTMAILYGAADAIEELVKYGASVERAQNSAAYGAKVAALISQEPAKSAIDRGLERSGCRSTRFT